MRDFANNGLLIFILLSSISHHLTVVQAQQPYVGKLTTDCNNMDNSTSSFGYTCNEVGASATCQSYLVFRSVSPYNSVSSVAKLLGADTSAVARINSVADTAVFDTNKLVIVPVTCSCSGAYYQKNTTYLVTPEDTYFSLANSTFQALTTCQALQAQNNVSARDLIGGTTIRVPLRCACPTANQRGSGIKYLLTYLIAMGDDIPTISVRFGANESLTRQANQLDETSLIYFFTTLLVPLATPPNAFQTDANPSPPPPSPPPPTATSTGGKSNLTWVYIVVGVLVGVGILVSIAIFVCCKARRRRKRSDKDAESESFELFDKPSDNKVEDESHTLDFMESLASISQSLKVYTYKELQAGTNDFSPECLIKGSVYRGTFNGDYAAIKKMSGDVTKEINILNKINHLNLIRLSGYCFNHGDSYLIYEYAINGPLSDWIYSSTGDGKHLTWTQRMQIVLDVAMGLNYLHSYTTPPQVHQDIKCSSVYLDSNFRAKIANFDMVRSAEGEDGKFVLTRHIVGTKGYMAPEYLENGLISTKLDVYAFGILLLEVLTGKPVEALYTKERKALTELLKPILHEEDNVVNLNDLVDPAMGDDYPPELAIMVAHLIDRCLNHNPSSRPGMDEVITNLSRILNSSLTWDFSTNASDYHSLSL